MTDGASTHGNSRSMKEWSHGTTEFYSVSILCFVNLLELDISVGQMEALFGYVKADFARGWPASAGSYLRRRTHHRHQSSPAAAPCSACLHAHSPHSDSHKMEACIGDRRDTKKQLHEIFKQRPELLVPVTELTPPREQRQIVRDCLLGHLGQWSSYPIAASTR
jgi:hypothetical protein